MKISTCHSKKLSTFKLICTILIVLLSIGVLLSIAYMFYEINTENQIWKNLI